MQQIYGLHYLRGLAMFFIVMTHTDLFIDRTVYVIGPRILDAFLWEWTAIFFLISGFLFQMGIPKYEAKQFFLSKIKRILIPYLLVSIPAILLYLLGFKNDHNWIDLEAFREHSVVYQVLFFYITGAHLGPLWFVPTLLLMFACAPLLVPLGRNMKALSVAAVLSTIALLFTSRPDDDSNNLISFINFLPVFIIGMFLYEKRDWLVSIGNSTKAMLAVFAVFAVLFALTFMYGQDVANLQKIVLFVLLYGLFDRLGAAHDAKTKTLAVMAEYSFAIYLIHGYFTGIMRMVLPMNENSFLIGLILCFVSAVIVMALSYISAFVVRLVFKDKSKILIGV